VTLVIVTPTNTTAPPITQVAGVAATATRVSEVGGISSLPRSGAGPGASRSGTLVIAGIVLMLAGGGTFAAGRRIAR
jgi:hypothetical protein